MKYFFNIGRAVLVTSALLGFGALAANAQTATPKPKMTKAPVATKHEHSSSEASGQQNSLKSNYKKTSKEAANTKKPKGLKSTAASGSAGQDNSFTSQPKKKKVKPTTPSGYTSSSSSGASGQDNSQSAPTH